MSRRKLVGLLALLTILALGGPSPLLAADDHPGYRQIEAGLPLPEGDLIEFFWYRCPHCYRMEGLLEKWQQANPDRKLVRIPAIVRPSWQAEARLFYVAQALGIEDKFHKRMFQTLHQERRPLDDVDQQAALFAELGVAPEVFRATLASEQVVAQVSAANELTRKVGVIGVPAFVIEGRWYTDSELAGGQEQCLGVADKLRGAKN